MTKIAKLITASLGAILCLVVFQAGAFAANNSTNSDIPEKNGVYDVPGHPNLKVRVFVHAPKKSTALGTWPTCTDDPDSIYVVGKTPWHLPANWSYVVNTSNAPASISGSSIPTIASAAFLPWQSNQSRVTINYAGTTKTSAKKLDGKNIVTFGRTSGSALGITYTWYYPATGLVAENDTILNLKYPWFWNQCNANAYDAQGILTHELGHWMGLNDEYADDYMPNTMYGYGNKGETKDMTLTNGDILGVQAIYNN